MLMSSVTLIDRSFPYINSLENNRLNFGSRIDSGGQRIPTDILIN